MSARRHARRGISLNFSGRRRRCCVATPPVLPVEAVVVSAFDATDLQQHHYCKGDMLLRVQLVGTCTRAPPLTPAADATLQHH